MRNLNKPNRYNVASIQAQQTLGGDVMESAEEGQYVAWRDYAWLLAEVERLRTSSFVTAVPSEEYENLKAEVERLTKLCQATSPDGFVHVRDIKHHPIMGPAWEERQKVANLIPPIVESNAIPEGKAVLVNIYQHQQDAEEIKRLKAEVERLRKAGDKLAGGRTHTFTIHGLLIPDPDVVAWNAAKEGKPSV